MWQPIETCHEPSLTNVLVWDGYEVTVAWQCDGKWTDALTGDWAETVEPTHWMPLPAPPQ